MPSPRLPLRLGIFVGLLILIVFGFGCAGTSVGTSSPSQTFRGSTSGQQGVGETQRSYAARPESVYRAAVLELRSQGFAIDTSETDDRTIAADLTSPSLQSDIVPIQSLRARLDSLRDGDTRVNLRYTYVRRRTLESPNGSGLQSPEELADRILFGIERRVGQRSAPTPSG